MNGAPMMFVRLRALRIMNDRSVSILALERSTHKTPKDLRNGCTVYSRILWGNPFFEIRIGVAKGFHEDHRPSIRIPRQDRIPAKRSETLNVRRRSQRGRGK